MTLLPALLVIPLAWALLSLVVPARWRAPLAWPGLALQLAAAVLLVLEVRAEGPVDHVLGGWQAPLGIALVADGLASVFVLVTALVAVAVAIYARGDLDPEKPAGAYFWPLYWFLWAALDGIWLAADLFNLYVGLEVLSLAAVTLVALSGSGAVAAALRYLLATLLGSLAYLAGVALFYAAYGTLALAQLGSVFEADATGGVALGLMTVGLAIKTALFPLHAWLPPAHGNASAPASALLSALVVKASFYILVRLWLDVAGADVPVAAAQLLGILGAGAVFWGGWQALRAERLKMVVAYSTVAQLGYLFLLFPLVVGTAAARATGAGVAGVVGTAGGVAADGVSAADAAAAGFAAAGAPAAAGVLAWDGAMYHAVSHALAKAAMFLSAGNLIRVFGGNHVDDLAGASRLMSVSLLSFGLAGVSLMGLPPSGGFVAKWLLIDSALLSGQWWWVPVLVGGGLLSAAYVFRIFRKSYLETAELQPPGPLKPLLDLPPLVLAVLAIVLGLASYAPLEQMRLGAPSVIGGGP